MKAKTRKSILKRFKITKTGKVLRRATGQNHFRAKKPGKLKREKRKWVELSKDEAKIIKRFLYFPKRK
ncbi:50S ribosomal protein L35 [bacterium]|nr:50S ribosomal protein L35 [bacterium]